MPSAVPARAAVRKRSPVAMCGTPRRSRRACAWVPLPAPGAPSSTTTVIAVAGGSSLRSPSPATSPNEALVVAHHQLRLDLLHGLDDDRHDDQQTGPAKRDTLEARVEDAGSH